MKRQAAIKLHSGKFSFDTLGYVTAEKDNVIFEFEIDSDKMTVAACDGYAAVRREGENLYEFELETGATNEFTIVTPHGLVPAGITGRKITLRRGREPGLFIKYCLNIGGDEEEGILTLRAGVEEESAQ